MHVKYLVEEYIDNFLMTNNKSYLNIIKKLLDEPIFTNIILNHVTATYIPDDNYLLSGKRNGATLELCRQFPYFRITLGRHPNWRFFGIPW